MKHAGRISGIAAAAGMLLLILDSKTALQGAREGLDLCIRTVIPSLFPFFVLANVLTSNLTGRRFAFLRPIGYLTGIPEGAESILLTGLLGGYPVGAGCICSAVKSGQLSWADGERMIAFCNNAGPSFLFGIAASLFPSGWMGWALWGIHILSSLLVGILMPGKASGEVRIDKAAPLTLSAALFKALRTIASVCGWVVLFRILLAFLNRWIYWALPDTLTVSLTGILELTNGCCDLANVGSIGLRFVLCSGMLAFGGICVAMQTLTVAREVSMKRYFPGKLLQTAISIWLSILLQGFLPDGIAYSQTAPILITIPAVLLISRFLLGNWQKSSSIPAKLGV